MERKSTDGTPQTKSDTGALLARLRRIEGQIRGIHRMVSEDRMCEDVLTQLMAARSSLDQVGLMIMDKHVEKCLLADLPSDTGLRNLQAALRMWLRFGAPSAIQE